MNDLRLPLVTGITAVLALVAGVLLHLAAAVAMVEPTRGPVAADPASPVPRTTATAPPSAQPTTVAIPASGIVRLEIPGLAIDVGASGETWPRASRRCHASTVCIDPPSLTEVAWYGEYALPSVPSNDSVLVFGHTNSINAEKQAFNNLLAARTGDTVVVTTETGVFTYVVGDVALVDYAAVPTSTLVYGHRPDTVVLVTCNYLEKAATVVVATLEDARPLT